MLYLFTFPSGMEWILIFLAVLLLFGGRKIPELMKGIGKGIREFNSAKDKVKDNLEEGMNQRDDDEAEKDQQSSRTQQQTQK